MNQRKTWLLIIAACAVCAAAALGVVVYRSRSATPAELMKRLPAQDALLLYIDFGALRQAGLLQLLDGSKMGQEADYLSFVHDTNFNYAHDLDSALAAFAPTGKYILAKGRFDWKALDAYTLQQHGQCVRDLCQMTGSQPDRKISFLPLQSGLMALAVSPDAAAALRLEASDSSAALPVPDAPVWMLLPPAVLKAPDSLPEGTRLFAQAVQDAKSVTLGFSPEGNRLAARLNVICKNDQDAELAAAALIKITQVLRELVAHANQKPQPGDLAQVLTSGKFENKGPRVTGYWPIDRAFVEQALSAK